MNTHGHGNCKNCNSLLGGNYCQNCGQAAHIHRYTMRHVLHEVFHSVTHTDRSALTFLWQILMRPGEVARDLFAGKRQRYFNLFTFFVLCTAIFTLSVGFSHYYEILNTSPMHWGDKNPWKVQQQLAYELMTSHGKMLVFSFLPINSLFTWLFFRRSKLNFAEHLVYNTVVFSPYVLFIAVATLLVLADHHLAGAINSAIQLFLLVYTSIGNRQLFHNNWFLTITKTLIIRFLSLLLIWTGAIMIVMWGYV
ncbi:DUF3667 domain-containing protein [Hufsiella ginkgonis]|uniref:DUF3667 domain-containing protein n=1 Tax=Hufsiella ginkgonis TaxID=2695274 RepID=A0A7K1XVN4_9SPHI|nr:DUF3667 domain-containing protein [Hufsiella ginkgonis]MXV14576.1 DUF3667 domain-containing protein [Hufsiella ginkgonis]